MQADWIDIIRIICVFQLFIFSSFLFIKRRKNLSSLLLGIHLITQALGIFNSFAVFNTYVRGNYPHLMLTGYPFMFLWGPTFYFYVKAFAFSDFKLKWNHLLHLIPFVTVVIYLCCSFYFYSAETKGNIIYSLIIWRHEFIVEKFIFLQILIYNIASLNALKSYSERIKDTYSSLQKIDLKWLKQIVICFISAYILSIVFSFAVRSAESNSFRAGLIFIDYLVYLVFFNIIFFKGWSHQETFAGIEEKVKYKSSNLTKEEAAEWIRKINCYMDDAKPYLNPGLTIDQIAEEINISTRILSQIINEYFKQNFYDYISFLRIEEAKKILSMPGNKKTVLEVIYETGYNSKSSFNTAFKKHTGLTPTEFKKRSKITEAVDN